MTIKEAGKAELEGPDIESISSDEVMPEQADHSIEAGEQDEFWNAETQSWDVDRLLQSYTELQSKMDQISQSTVVEADESATQEAAASDQDASAEETYGKVVPESPMFQAIAEKITGLGLDQSQSSQVLDIVHECIEYGELFLDQQIQSGRELARIESHFGGPAPWSKICSEMASWAEKNLDEQLYQSLSSSYDGIIKMHEMMQSNEPQTIGRPDGLTNDLSEEKLFDLMRDPRYWRDHDSSIVETVTSGFRRIYGD